MQKEFLIEVYGDHQGGHVVQVKVKVGGKEVGTAQLPGGTRENAKAMAEGLVALVESGVDLTAILPTQAENKDDEK